MKRSRGRAPRAAQHGPENAEHELKIAYNNVIENGVTHFWDRRAIIGVNAYEGITLYRKAYDAYQAGDKLVAERWARAAKHLARAFWHEAKIDYLEPRITELPFLDADEEEYGAEERSDTAADLIESVSSHVPQGLEEIPEEMLRYIHRGRRHLAVLDEPGREHPLARAEHIKAAYEYARTVECMALAYEAEFQARRVA